MSQRVFTLPLAVALTLAGLVGWALAQQARPGQKKADGAKEEGEKPLPVTESLRRLDKAVARRTDAEIPLHLYLGESLPILRLKERPSRLQTSDPLILDLMLVSAKTVALTPKRTGLAQVRLSFDDEKTQAAAFSVTLRADVRERAVKEGEGKRIPVKETLDRLDKIFTRRGDAEVPLDLTVGGLPLELRTKEMPGIIICSDPKVLGFKVLDPKSLELRPLKPGRTPLAIWFGDPIDESKQYIVTLKVRVEGPAPQPEQKKAEGRPGPFAVAASGETAVLLDTAGGKTWVLRLAGNGGAVWLPVHRLDSEKEAREWLERERAQKAALEDRKRARQEEAVKESVRRFRQQQEGMILHSAREDRERARKALEEAERRLRELAAADPAASSPPLHAAARAGDVALIKMLLTKGAAVNEQDGLGRTALWVAVSQGKRDAAEALLIGGANVNGGDGKRLPLHLAVSRGEAKMVALLLLKGANVNAKDADGNTPLGLAKAKGHEDIIAILKRSGASDR